MGEIKRWHRILALSTLALVMVYVRVRTATPLLAGDRVAYRGVDAYYHLRHVNYAVQHWPRTLSYDVYTNFPHGNAPGQFGTPYDLAVATVAKFTPVSPEIALFYAPVALAVAALAVVYQLAQRLYTPTTALLTAAVFALQPGIILQRTLAGMSDHHAAETTLMALSLLLVVGMLQSTSRRAIAYATVAGGVTAVYLWTWPPGVFLLAVYALGFWLALSTHILRGSTPRSVTPPVVYLAITGVLVLPLRSTTVAVTSLSLLHTVLPLAAAGVLLASYTLRDRQRTYLATTAVAATGTLTAGVTLAPGHVNSLLLMSQRFVFFGSDANIAETAGWASAYSQLGLTPIHAITFLYGASALVAVVGVIYAYTRGMWSLEMRAVLGVWLIVLTCMSITQLRFHYYYALAVVVFAGAALEGVLVVLPSSHTGLHAKARVVLLVLLTLSVPLAQSTLEPDTSERGDWRPALDYLESETPQPSVAYHGTYARTDDFDYPRGSYGVLSWWDYGHWITVLGRRPAVTNPHQQQARLAAQYFLATNESHALELLDRMEEDDAPVRYIVLDESMTDPDGRLASISAYHPGLELSDIYRDGHYTSRFNESVLYMLRTGSAEQWTKVYSQRNVTIYRRSASENASNIRA